VSLDPQAVSMQDAVGVAALLDAAAASLLADPARRGSSVLLPRRGRILLTGDLFGAKEALDMNLISEIVPDAEVEKRAVAMAAQIAELPPIAIQQAQESIIRGADASLETGLTLETRTLQMLFASQDQKEGMAAFIEKRKPKFVGK
jgi:enoyl-CoA hydratase/carnithine racemase